MPAFNIANSHLRIAVFAGTADGRALGEYLVRLGCTPHIFVATDYGAKILRDMPGVVCHVGRLDAQEMARVLIGFDVVVDATHPYATEAHENIKQAACACRVPYLRMEREALPLPEGCIAVGSAADAAKYLQSCKEAALITTGVKELGAFTAVSDFAARLFVRILPVEENVQRALELGFLSSHITAAKGPFSHAENAALLRACDARWMVTKEGGHIGGFDAKVSAAKEVDVRLIVITRPVCNSKTYSFDEVCNMLRSCCSK